MIFNFFKKKKNIDTSAIKNFNKALITIRDFIALQDFDKADMAINEVIRKETDAFNIFILNLTEKQKKSEINSFNKKITALKKLSKINQENKLAYNKKLLERKQKEELKNVNNEIKEYIWKKEYYQAVRLLNVFLEWRTSDIKYAQFWTEWKKIINKKIEQQKKLEEKAIRNDAFREAKKLIWDIKIDNFDESKIINKEDSFLTKLKKSVFIYTNFKKRLRDKKLYDEVLFLLSSNDDKNKLILKSKLAAIHSWFSKKIYWERVDWYDIFWQTYSADKISWDSIWYSENKNDYKFFIWDATGHWIKAWFIVSQITKLFSDLSTKKGIKELSMEINNFLKQDLKSWNFITSIFFSISKKDKNNLEIVWMWHEPIFLFRKKIQDVEKIIPWWLAAWIRLMKSIDQVKSKIINMEDWDIAISYSDWIIEAKNDLWEMYWFDRLANKFKDLCLKNLTLENINKLLIADLKKFSWWKDLDQDDITIFLIKRSKEHDFLNDKNKALEFLTEQGLTKKQLRIIKWKTQKEALEQIKVYQKQNSLIIILKNLDYLYRIWELPKLKQECIRYIKEGYIHKKLNYYLKKAIENESFFKIKQKNKKVQDKYNVLKELYKKWQYDTVIMECSEIIQKDWNI